MDSNRVKKAVSLETFVFLIVLVGGFWYVGSIMGVDHLFSTIMGTAHDLLLQTVFLIMAISVLAGAIAALLNEFGVVALINKIISPVMGPLYGLPGAASIGAITTYLSDNPAIITLAHDEGFKKFFKDYQIPCLCNLGTSFGMGLVLSFFMIGLDASFITPVIIGNIGAIVGSIVSVRLMLRQSKKYYNVTGKEETVASSENAEHNLYREVREGNIMQRVLETMLDGGKSGVELGLAIIPGVLIICTIVMILTNQPPVVDGVVTYSGAAYEGIGLLPKIGKFFSPILTPLFGFQSPEAIAFPITSLGAVGAAMGLVGQMLQKGLIGGNEIAVFTAIGMCWSGYLSTHVGMMDALNRRPLTSKAILSHTIGGICAGVFAHYAFVLLSML